MMWVRNLPEDAEKVKSRQFLDLVYGYKETLYEGKDGTFYLVGKGGPGTIWGIRLYDKGNWRAPGKGILQLELEEVADWLNGVSWKFATKIPQEEGNREGVAS